MEQRALGTTGLRVSAMGYGAGNIGGLMVRGDPAERRETVATALDGGITYFDTAPQYGDGCSEEHLGRALRELDALERVVIGTKVRLVPADLPNPERAIRRSVEASLRRLGRGWVDLVQLHNHVGRESTRPGDAVDPRDVVGAVAAGLRAVVTSGLARHIGFTALGATASTLDVVGSGHFATAQVYVNALNPSALEPGANGGAQEFDGLAHAAANAGLGIIAIRVLAAGALNVGGARHPVAGDPGGALAPGADYAADLKRANKLQPVVAEFGLENALELGLRFVLSWTEIATALTGVSDRDQLTAVLRWASRGPLPAEALRRIVEVAREHSAAGG